MHDSIKADKEGLKKATSRFCSLAASLWDLEVDTVWTLDDSASASARLSLHFVNCDLSCKISSFKPSTSCLSACPAHLVTSAFIWFDSYNRGVGKFRDRLRLRA